MEAPNEPVTYQDYVVYKFQAQAVIAQCNNRLEAIKLEYKQ